MKKPIRNIMISLITFLFVLNGNLIAQNESKKIDDTEKKQVVDSIRKFMKNYYVFPDVGNQIAELVAKNYEKGVYKSAKTYSEFSQQINKDLLSINNDKHIGMRYMPEEIMRMKESEKNNDDSYEKLELMRAKNNNFGFKELKILTGNIGYLKLNGFFDAEIGGETAIAAMNFLANTKAVIIDLTDNGGGSPSMIQLISSYFFEDTKHLNSFYIREGDKTKQFWTQAVVQGPKMVNTDLYILTSSRTFSAAEEFTYNLKNMKRASIVGETTGGGAHPVSGHMINDNFIVRVPFGKAVNPITKTNWEGTGIKPHIEVKRDHALNTAWLTALKKLNDKEKNKQLKDIYLWAIEGLDAKVNPLKLEQKTLESYVGKYGPRAITYEDGQLYYQREDRPKYKMVPIKEDYFYFEDLDYFRLRIIKKNNEVVALEGNYEGGYKDRSDKDK